MGRTLTRRFKRTLRDAIFGIDRALRRWHGVRAFSAGRDDLLRVSVRRAKRDLILPDGARIVGGDAILDLHIWNERVSDLGRRGSTLGWASRLQRRIDHSLSNLAARIRAEPSLQSCKAVRAEAIFAVGRDAAAALRIGRYFGLSLIEGRTASLGESLVSFGLAWACNPQSLRGKPFRRVCSELWMSRAALLERYPAPEAGRIDSPAVAPAPLADSAALRWRQ